RSSTISATWSWVGRPSNGSPVTRTASSQATIRSSATSIRARATRSTPSPCTRRRRARSRNSRSVFKRSGFPVRVKKTRQKEIERMQYQRIGFIGLGVMGEPICRNLVKKSGARVIAFDLAAEPLQRLLTDGAAVAGAVGDVVAQSEIVFLCLPSAKHVRAVFEGDGIFKKIRDRQIVVDLGTSSVSQTRDFARRLQARGAAWLDAPIARTRQAAQDGTLSVMVGGPRQL